MAEITVTMDSNADEILDELKNKIQIALEECGLAAEGYAKRLCPVDTGLLRNSITHALDGEPTAISDYQDNLKQQSGSYSGSMPEESDGKRAVYIGTNVEYGPYVEMGTSRTRAQPYLKPAVVDHADDYKRIFENRMRS